MGRMSTPDHDTDAERDVTFGQTVYDGSGNELGHVRGLDEDGFYVTIAEGVTAMSTGHDADNRTGVKELHWRCWDCGEIGALAEMPEECPNCGAPEEELYYWQQD